MANFEFEYLEPLSNDTPIRSHDIATFDLESKDGDSQRKGFTRPFMVGFYDGVEYREFRDSEEAKALPWQERAISPGGCIDRFLVWLLTTPEGRGQRGKIIYGHNAGNFDSLFLLPWLRTHADDFEMEILPMQSCIVELKIKRRPAPQDEGDTGKMLAVRSWLTEFANGIQNNDEHKLGIMPGTKLKRLRKIWARVPASVLHGFEKFARSQKVAAKSTKKSRARRTWIIRDSVRLVPRTLDSLAETFKVTRKQITFDLNTHEDDPRWGEYNRLDCQALYEGMTAFHGIVEGLNGEVRSTTPATAMALFRRAYLRQKVPRHAHFSSCPEEARTRKDNPCQGCLHDWIRQAVHGGRTEIFNIRGEDLRYFDFNSSYASVMREPMPVGNKIEVRQDEDYCDYQYRDKYGKPVGERVDLRERHVGFIECDVEIPDTCYLPPLPVYEDGKLIFRNGRMHGVWAYSELLLLGEPEVNGKIVSITGSVWYEGKAILKEMMTDLYKYRDKNAKDYTKGLSETAKLLCNSMFGKTIMRPDRKKVVFRRLLDTVPDGAARAKVKGRCKECKGSGFVDGKACETCYKARLAHAEEKADECKVCKGEKVVDGATCKACFNKLHSGVLEPLPHGAIIPCHDGTGMDPVRDMLSEVYYLPIRIRASYIVPQIGAQITALARVKLWKAMASVMRLGGKLYYADTDSCICWLPPGLKLSDCKDLNIGEALGALKDEYASKHLPSCKDKSCKGCCCKDKRCKGCSHHRIRGTFFLPKLYDLEDLDGRSLPKAHQIGCKDLKCEGCSSHTIAAKGIPRDRKTLQTLVLLTGVKHSEWSAERLYLGRENNKTERRRTIHCERLQKFGGMAQADFAAMPKIESIKKSMQSDYNKRAVYSNGTTEPWGATVGIPGKPGSTGHFMPPPPPLPPPRCPKCGAPPPKRQAGDNRTYLPCPKCRKTYKVDTEMVSEEDVADADDVFLDP
jgi:hypothetical protein